MEVLDKVAAEGVAAELRQGRETVAAQRVVEVKAHKVRVLQQERRHCACVEEGERDQREKDREKNERKRE